MNKIEMKERCNHLLERINNMKARQSPLWKHIKRNHPKLARKLIKDIITKKR